MAREALDERTRRQQSALALVQANPPPAPPADASPAPPLVRQLDELEAAAKRLRKSSEKMRRFLAELERVIASGDSPPPPDEDELRYEEIEEDAEETLRSVQRARSLVTRAEFEFLRAAEPRHHERIRAVFSEATRALELWETVVGDYYEIWLATSAICETLEHRGDLIRRDRLAP